MSISINLRVLASKLEKNSDDLLIRASEKGPEVFEKVATAVAAASSLMEEVADDIDNKANFDVTEKQLDEMAALATAFDKSGDPLLKKQASVLDDILLSIAASKTAALESRKVYDDEITRLRDELRRVRKDEAYVKPAQDHAAMHNKVEQAKAVAQQVKRYRPLEAPLQTRYPPDRPGGQMTRITDHVYQDIVTGIIYDYKSGYKTQKGNEVPGGAVEYQSRDFGDVRNQGASLFETRESIMNRFASDDFGHLKKYAMGEEIATAIQVCRDAAPELLNSALDCAYDDGLSTSDVAGILTDSINQYREASPQKIDEILKAAGSNYENIKKVRGASEVAIALSAIQELAPHLLKSAIAKAKKAGLNDSQIKYVLSSDFVTKFDKTDDEVKTAKEIILPQLKSLGWSDLISSHLKALAYSIDKKQLSKLASEFLILKKNSKLDKLSSLARILKRSQFKEFDFGEPGPSGLELDFEDEKPQESGIELAIEPQISPAPEGMPSFLQQEPTAIPKVVDTKPQDLPSFLQREETKEAGPITPFSNLEAWGLAYAAAVESTVGDKKFSRLLNRVDDGKPKYSNKQKHVMLMHKINQMMKAQGFAGAYDKAEIPEGDNSNYEPTDFSYVTYKDVYDKNEKRVKKPAEENLEELGDIVEPSNILNIEGEPATRDSVVNWPKYIQETGVNVTNEIAERIDSQIEKAWHARYAKYKGIMDKFSFGGTKDMSSEFKKLPKTVQEELVNLFFMKEATPAIMEKFPMIVAKAYAQRDIENKIREAESLEGPEGENLLNEAQYLDELFKSADPQLVSIYKEQIDKYPMTEDRMAKIRSYILSSGKAREAESKLKEARNVIRKETIDRVLTENGLPSYFKEKAPSLAEFSEDLEHLGEKEDFIKELKKRNEIKKRKPTKIIELPTDNDGEELIPLWEMGQPYMDELLAAYNAFPPDFQKQEGRDYPIDMNVPKRDEFMKSKGFVPPSEKIIGGRVSTTNLISSMRDLWGKGRILENAVDPTIDTGDSKTLFSDPEDYVRAYVDVKKQFPWRGAELPVEFAQITSKTPKGMSYVPGPIKNKVGELLAEGMKDDKIIDVMTDPSENGIGKPIPSEATVSILEWMKNSGKKIRGLMWSQALKGKSADEIKKVIDKLSEKNPDFASDIKPGVIDFFVDRVRESMAREKESANKIDELMKAQGFYPPSKPLIGEKSTAEILKQKGRKNPYQDMTGLKPMSEL